MRAFDCHFAALPGFDTSPSDVALKLAENLAGQQIPPENIVVVRPVFAEDGAHPLDLETVRRRAQNRSV